MGEKETATGMASERTTRGHTISLDDDKGAVRLADDDAGSPPDAGTSVQWEPHKAPGLDQPEQEGATGAAEDGAALKTRHDTVKNSIGNIR